jgi:hypothetical protein
MTPRPIVPRRFSSPPRVAAKPGARKIGVSAHAGGVFLLTSPSHSLNSEIGMRMCDSRKTPQTAQAVG